MLLENLSSLSINFMGTKIDTTLWLTIEKYQLYFVGSTFLIWHR